MSGANPCESFELVDPLADEATAPVYTPLHPVTSEYIRISVPPS